MAPDDKPAVRSYIVSYDVLERGPMWHHVAPDLTDPHRTLPPSCNIMQFVMGGAAMSSEQPQLKASDAVLVEESFVGI